MPQLSAHVTDAIQGHVVSDVLSERVAQDAIFGNQDPCDGTSAVWTTRANAARRACQQAFDAGVGTFVDIALEEVMEAFAETDPEKLYAEVIQCAAVFVKWAERIKIRGAKPSPSWRKENAS
jgi:hypothetical protein